MNRSKLFLMLVLSFSLNTMYASESKQELISFTKEVVETKLHSIGLAYFMEKTNIVRSLQGDKYPLGVANALELAYYDFYEYMQKGQPAQMFRMTQVQMEMHKSLIYETLLKDHPAALTELQEAGIYQPRK